MATDRLINQTQGEDIIDKLNEIASNVGDIKFGPQVQSSNVVSMTGYAEASTADAISQGDTLNEAIGKLEKKADDNASAVADKIDKLTSATAGDIATVTATGEIADSAVAIETTLSDSSDAKVPTSKAVGTYVDGKGYAVGVSSSTANHIVTFNGTDGKALKDSGYTVNTTLTNVATDIPTGAAVSTALADKVDKVTGKGLSENDYTTTEKNKLSGIEAQANKTVVDASLSDSSTNPVQNKVINTALAGKVDKVTGKGLSENDYTTTEKNKLSGIEAQANKTVVDASLSDSSTNPVQNKVINTALAGKVAGPNSSTSNDIMLFSGTTGKVASDSGVQIETNTSFSDTSDAKIPTSKSIAKNVAGKAVLTNYSAATAQETISASTTIKDAVEQLDYRTTTNQTNILLMMNGVNHNMIYRGQNLGATLTDAQHTALSSGNFTDLYLGDYWTKTVTIPAGTYTGGDGEEVTVPDQTNITLKAVIADFDTFYGGYNSSYAIINTHHAAVIVTGFSNVVWNKTNSTAGGYVASLIHKWLVGSALPQLETWFGSAKVLSHQKLLTNAITGDAASGWAWSSQKIALLSENQMYGSKVWGNSQASNGGYEPGEAHKHLNVFNHIAPNMLFGNKNIWLRDIASAGWAAGLYDGGGAIYTDASNSRVAPAALILLS